MVVSHLVWLLRTRGIQRRAKEAGKTFDEYEEGIEWQSNGIDVEMLLKGMLIRKSKAKAKKGSSAGVDDIEASATPEEVIPKTIPNATV